MRYTPPTRRGAPVSHYLVAVDPGTARPGVSVWGVVLSTDPDTDAPTARPTLLAARAPRPPRNPEHYPGSAAAAAKLVEDVVNAVIGAEFESLKHLTIARQGGLLPKIALVVEWPVNYATKTATRDDVRGLRDMIAALPWTPRPGGKYKPAEWKGNVPKEITSARTIAALGKPGACSFGGLTFDDLVDDDPNARDALALGAFALGIVGRGCAKV